MGAKAPRMPPRPDTKTHEPCVTYIQTAPGPFSVVTDIFCVLASFLVIAAIGTAIVTIALKARDGRRLYPPISRENESGGGLMITPRGGLGIELAPGVGIDLQNGGLTTGF